jgi:hypothetical protein
MKKYIVYLFLAILPFSSCKNFLDETTYGLVVPSTYPTTLNDLDKCVNALYSMTTLMYNEAACFTALWGGDDVTTQSGGNKNAFLQFDIFSAQDNNERIYGHWDNPYNVIKQANVIIESMDNIEELNKPADLVASRKDRALGQAFFLRSLAYFSLVRVFGEVPIVVGFIPDYNIEKSSFLDIYQLIESDLLKAVSLLPVDYRTAANASDLEKTTYYARVTSGAAKSLLAPVYLTWAGYPLKDNAKYALAAQKAKEVVDAAGTYGYEILPNYADLWKWQNGWKDAGNAEGVFTCHYNSSAGDWSDGGTWANGNMNAPCAWLPEKPFGGWSDGYAELQFFLDFPEGPRKDATFLTEAKVTAGSVPIPWENFASKHPYYKKWLDLPGFDYENIGTYVDWWSSRTVQVIRYAEVLLIYAEAQAMANGTPNDLAYDCLNRVRNRAGLEDMTTGLNGAAFRDAVVTERKWEFAGCEPCARWYDMVRTETVAAATAKRHPSEVPLVGTPNDATHVGYFAPILEADKQINPNL